MKKFATLLVLVLFAAAVWSQQSTVGGGSGGGQPASANLTNWSNVATNQVTFKVDFQAFTNTALTSITNAGNATYSLINNSNAPVPALKSLSISGGTLTDQGTNILITPSDGGGEPVLVRYTPLQITNQYACTTQMVADNSIPQSSEGDPILTNSVTMTSATNWLEITLEGHCSADGIKTGVGAVFVGSETDARDVKYLPTIPASGYIANMCTVFTITNGWAGTSNIVVRVGPTVAGTYYVNRNTTTATFGGTSRIRVLVKEIKPYVP